ncbi:DMT family transporter [Pseudooceanicola sediminis]|uniref:DMT family transporter n=1 Tax=Pseudooceanicola sediminis TaxID=2211117 RepID=A0A399J1T2_9RHOB|nr:DMT family transporter [Pseudooceanicola sediminis]KAA2316330.1 DMT family transporter [Puniceibacterium sp. HSS470]RII39244.1 DMT family transporter [Pseudooceanicola sediminis]|tara:strand:+ start:28872 stop:29759 length:888 start_codon:yes stop_codon:yes gene_type:complete
MNIWIGFTLAAVVLQTARFMLQKHLSGAGLSPAGATFARFLWAAPVVWAALLISGLDWPDLTLRFWGLAILGGVTQILATVCVVALFRSRNFAVGITLKKTEVLLTAFIGFLILGETVSLAALLAICVGLFGVLALTDTPVPGGRGLSRFANRAAGLGLTSGLFFALSGVTYRGASLEVPGGPEVRALITLVAVVTSQLLLMGAWLAWREKGEITRVITGWRVTSLVGLTSVAGSFCWFSAFTLQNAAYVYAVGQSEVVLSLLASVLFFRETLSRREGLGIALISISVLALIVLT